MKKYFAKLDGDIVGIDAYIRFEAENEQLAKEFAVEIAEENYSSYDDPYDEDETALFHSTVKEYDPKIHDEYFDSVNSSEWEILL